MEPHGARAAVERVTRSHGIFFWGDYQARIDLLNFYNTQSNGRNGVADKIPAYCQARRNWSNA